MMAARILCAVLSGTSVHAATLIVQNYAGTVCAGDYTYNGFDPGFPEVTGAYCRQWGNSDSIRNDYCDMTASPPRYKATYYTGSTDCSSGEELRDIVADGTCTDKGGWSQLYMCLPDPPPPPSSPPPTAPPPPPPTAPPPASDMTGVIVAAAAGGAALIGAAVGVYCYIKAKGKGKQPSVPAAGEVKA